MTAFRKGDVATIDVIVVSRFNDANVHVKPVDGYQEIYLKPGELTMKRPLIEVGDRVELILNGLVGQPVRATVKAIDGDRLWVERDVGSYDTWETARIRRVDSEFGDLVCEVVDGPQPAPPDRIVHSHTNIAGVEVDEAPDAPVDLAEAS